MDGSHVHPRQGPVETVNEARQRFLTLERGGKDHEEGKEIIQGLGGPDVHTLCLQEGKMTI